MKDLAMKRVLVVCTGNTCRSPMAEGWLNKRLAGSRWVAGSAGLATVNGARAAAEAVEVMREVGVDIAAHGSQMFSQRGMLDADVILAMTEGHRREVIRRFPEAESKTFLMRGFGEGTAGDVEDPLGFSIEVYRLTRDELVRAAEDFVLFLEGRGEL